MNREDLLRFEVVDAFPEANSESLAELHLSLVARNRLPDSVRPILCDKEELDLVKSEGGISVIGSQLMASSSLFGFFLQRHRHRGTRGWKIVLLLEDIVVGRYYCCWKIVLFLEDSIVVGSYYCSKMGVADRWEPFNCFWCLRIREPDFRCPTRKAQGPHECQWARKISHQLDDQLKENDKPGFLRSKSPLLIVMGRT